MPDPAAALFWLGFAPPGHASTLLDGYAGERLRMATFRHSPHVLTGDAVGRDHRRAVLLSRHLDGDAVIEQNGRRNEIGAGDFCLIDLSRPFRLETARATVQTVYLPMAALREAVPRIDQVSAIGLHGHLAAVAYLRVLFQELFAHAAELTEAVAGRLADAIPHMLAAALESMDAVDVSPSQLRQQYKQQVRRFAREHLADPGLCAEMIGRGVGLSSSYLFELFADEERTLMRWVRGERLARCQRELADPALRHRSIAQIAQSWGFGDMAHFSRLFREAVGASPRSFRQESLASPHRVQFLSDVQTAGK
jgi:AraC-like DNA-binding protein